jgi:calcineurin-like phosphoesterase family protein
VSIFFTADTHFEHNRILLHAKRPWTTVDEMNEALMKKWNQKVKRQDTVYIVGDFAWKNHNYYIAKLNGKKILILGSHDHMSLEIQKNFTEVHDCRMISIDGQSIWLSHCAHRVWEKGHYGTPHFFGHSHGRLITYNLSRDVGIDTHDADYAPFEWPVLREWVKRRYEEMKSMGRIVEERGKQLYRQDDVSWALNIPVKGVDCIPDGYRHGGINDKEEEEE